MIVIIIEFFTASELNHHFHFCQFSTSPQNNFALQIIDLALFFPYIFGLQEPFFSLGSLLLTVFLMLPLPIFITNFKNFEQATGANAVKMAKIHEKVAEETGMSIGVAVPSLDLYRVASQVKIPVFGQHADPIDYGNCTGHILPQGIRKSGAIGAMINHSERRIDPEKLEPTAACIQKASLLRLVCAEDPDEIEKFSGFEPDFLAFEPPELIGSTSAASVATENPASIKESVDRARGIPVLVGAGVATTEDVKVSLELGAQGFLVATAVVKADDVESKLRELVLAMK